MKIIIAFIIISFLAVSVSGCQTPSRSASFTDDAGRTITINNKPQRIVSHVPAITEILFALGLGDKVVGVSDYDDFPPEAKEKTSVGNYFNPSLERIMSLNPDLVLTDGNISNITQLDNLHLTYILLNPENYEGVIKDIELLGKINGVEQSAQKLIDSMNSQLERRCSKG